MKEVGMQHLDTQYQCTVETHIPGKDNDRLKTEILNSCNILVSYPSMPT